MFIYDEYYIFYAILILAITLFAQIRIHMTFRKYSKIKCNMTGFESANLVLKQNDVNGVKFYKSQGYLSDHFDPRDNSISLSGMVYDDNSISALGVGAHEAGHAVQMAQDYFPMKLRHRLVLVTNFSSMLAMPLVFLGLISVQDFLVTIGIVLFSISVLFHIVTLPVESNASKRALLALEESGKLSSDELEGAKKVLMAARFTYIAALLTSILSLLRLIMIANRNKRR